MPATSVLYIMAKREKAVSLKYKAKQATSVLFQTFPTLFISSHSGLYLCLIMSSSVCGGVALALVSEHVSTL